MKNLAKELNALLYIEPEIDEDAKPAVLKKQILAAAKELVPEDEEDLSKEAITTLKKLGAWPIKDAAEEQPEEEEEPEEEAPKTKKFVKTKGTADKDKSTKKKADPSKSNKGQVYLAYYEKGEKDPAKLNAVVEDALKESTIKSWVKSWDKGACLPAIANKK